jgi:hypothetical protein
MSVASLQDCIRQRRDEEIAALELDIALWSATVRLIHEAWKDPAFRAACEHLTSSQIHARVASKLRTMKATAEDDTPVPITRALEAIGNIPHITHDEDGP